MTLKKIEDVGSDETIYLDWNIFNKLENIDKLPDEQKDSYVKLAAFISTSSVSCPYSNAHMNDLYRGYVKDPTYAKGHIENITALTRNLCITQYWGEKQVRWHQREASHYLDDTILAKNQDFSSLDSILYSDDYPELQIGFDFTKSILQITPIDKRQYLDVNHTAEFLYCSKPYVYELKHRISYILRCGRLYFKKSDLENYLEVGKRDPDPAKVRKKKTSRFKSLMY